MVPPFIDEISPMFHLQINGEVVYKWRDVYGRPRTVCDLLQASILPLGYEMTESVRERVGKTTAESIRRFWRKMQSTKDGKKRKRIKAETWIKLAIRPDEIKQTPNDVLAQLTEDNSKLRAAVDEKAADLYDEMRQRLAHSGKEFTEVGKKQ